LKMPSFDWHFSFSAMKFMTMVTLCDARSGNRTVVVNR
jgi:hypothetical protein